MPPPPADPELKQHILDTARAVHQYGAQYEDSLRHTGRNDLRYAFLFGGDGAKYYEWAVGGFRQGLHQGQAQGCAAASAAPSAAGPQLSDGELNDVLSTLARQATQDAIRSARQWLELQSVHAHALGTLLRTRIEGMPTFAHRLHTLYLIHDLLTTEIGKEKKPEDDHSYVCACRPQLVWMLRSVHVRAAYPDPPDQVVGDENLNDRRAKVLKLLDLWSQKGIVLAESV